MKKVIVCLAYIWAFICILLVPITFIKNDSFAHSLATLSFMKVNPKFTGGDVGREIQHGTYKTQIYRPVFEALIGKSSSGFVQIKWDGGGSLPERITESIDYDQDGTVDFSVDIDTRKSTTSFTLVNKKVKGLRVSSKVKGCWLIRVDLKR